MPLCRTAGCTITLWMVAAKAASLLARAKPTRLSLDVAAGASDPAVPRGECEFLRVMRGFASDTPNGTRSNDAVHGSPAPSAARSLVFAKAVTTAELLLTALASLWLPLQSAVPKYSASRRHARLSIGTSFLEWLHSIMLPDIQSIMVTQTTEVQGDSSVLRGNCAHAQCWMNTLGVTDMTTRANMLRKHCGGS